MDAEYPEGNADAGVSSAYLWYLNAGQSPKTNIRGLRRSPTIPLESINVKETNHQHATHENRKHTHLD